MNVDNKTISLVLGSGGARGLAHIGVIQVLEERGYLIRSISGSSMGALIGGIYAAGELDTYSEWVCALDRIDVLRLLDFSFSGAALFKGDKIINTLRELIGDRNIEDLPISFTAVATDLEESKEVWLSSGSLFSAIRASISFPTIFSAFPYKGKTLVDGGLLNPIPIAPTLRDQTGLTIAVGLCGKPRHLLDAPVPTQHAEGKQNKYQQKIIDFIDGLQRKNGNKEPDTGMFDIISKSLDAMQSTISSFKLAAYSPDIVIEIPKNVCTIYEFERAEELIEIGRQEATARLNEFDDSI
ncbi:patatin-like phospholipase family protein [uncultured Desulfuromusa sp.]|uniref:patatin-like phospholipase family protein n=1 Tax=uncultured Desulfuromusa sp. TaxID=219183 RepID=UPI002AA8ACE2|nr:patatin-like phospholipase family protein [uncultured Desulfuromusa sp.]